MISVRVPQLVPASLNARENWRAKAARVKYERGMVRLVLSSRTPPPLPVVVTLIRCAPRLLDDDNAVGAMKAARDEVAKWLGVDDADSRVQWKVEQVKMPKLRQGTIVQLSSAGPIRRTA